MEKKPIVDPNPQAQQSQVKASPQHEEGQRTTVIGSSHHPHTICYHIGSENDVIFPSQKIQKEPFSHLHPPQSVPISLPRKQSSRCCERSNSLLSLRPAARPTSPPHSRRRQTKGRKHWLVRLDAARLHKKQTWPWKIIYFIHGWMDGWMDR